MQEFLRPTPAVDSDNELIRNLSLDLTRGLNKEDEKAIKLFYWVRDEIKYRPLVPLDLFEDYRASKTLESGIGFCVEKAAVLMALGRVAGIPGRFHLADIRNHLISDRLMNVMRTNVFICHGYCELFLKGKWVKATPAFDSAMCRENRIKPVEFDAEHDAVFHSHNLDGDLHIEYVRDRGSYSDVPMRHILDMWKKSYDPECMDRVSRYIEEQEAWKIENKTH